MESKGKVTVAATSVPHAEILEAAKPLMAAKGWELVVTEFTDYVQPVSYTHLDVYKRQGWKYQHPYGGG